MITKHIVLRNAPLYAVADGSAPLETECLFGEQFEVNQEVNHEVNHEVSQRDGIFSFGRLLTDGYEGWVPTAALGELPNATHRLSALASWVLADDTIKSQPLMSLSIGSVINVNQQADSLCAVAMPTGTRGYMPKSHIVAIDSAQPDWVSVAESCLGVPYLWGGRTHSGLDCSALVQLAAQSAQLLLPRNSSQQQGEGVAVEHIEHLQRGDLVFWKGHVGIMQSATQLLHANAHHMQVSSEPLQIAVKRINQKEGPITALKRLVS